MYGTGSILLMHLLLPEMKGLDVVELLNNIVFDFGDFF